MLWKIGICLTLSIIAGATEDRDKRFFSLFSVVNFQNEVCTGTSGAAGTCYTESECTDKSGTTDGNCASGFGVCCSFKVQNCSSTAIAVDNNATYIQNPSYPTTHTTPTSTETCSFSITRLDNICQLRLDFDAFKLDAPATTGACTDKIEVTSPTGGVIPALCGTLTGQHLYVETGSTSTMATIKLTIGTTTATRTWNVKVSAIECEAIYKAPVDCLQYFTGSSGNIQSFNHGQQIRDVKYTMCIRAESGYCSITYQASSTASPVPWDFLPSPATTSKTNADCLAAKQFLQISGASAYSICGTIFCDNTASVNACPVSTTTVPFEIGVFADGATDMSSQAGFNLDYIQQPC